MRLEARISEDEFIAWVEEEVRKAPERNGMKPTLFMLFDDELNMRYDDGFLIKRWRKPEWIRHDK